MKVLVVNHGFPPTFNAGSEIYTQTLVEGLCKAGLEVRVFSRFENPFVRDFEVSSKTVQNNGISYQIDLINVARQKDRYVTTEVDQKFNQILAEFRPNIVHFNHLNHLSLGLISEAHSTGSKIVFTLHDFWLACPRGQFLQINYGEAQINRLCHSQEDRKCAVHCYSRYFSGIDHERDIEYWENWVRTRREEIGKLLPKIDLFISPSEFLGSILKKELGISNLSILDYGFNLDVLEGRQRDRGTEIVFGYIGTHIRAKGIHHLIEAFSKVRGSAKLLIFGRERNETTPYLKELASGLRIEWLPEYQNEDIVEKVFNHVDVIVVPSIWFENSPLVIHEALQTRTLVITANVGGMAEFIKDGLNGLTFRHRDIKSLSETMQKVVDNPSLIDDLGQRGYINSPDGNVLSQDMHIEKIIHYYRRLSQ